LLEGWELPIRSIKSSDLNNEPSVHKFRHQLVPAYKFDFPFPLLQPPTADQPGFLGPQLTFEAQSYTLFLDPCPEDNSGSDPFTNVDLIDGEGKWAGTLGAQFGHNNDYGQDTPCDLFAISHQRAQTVQREELTMKGLPSVADGKTDGTFEDSEKRMESYLPFEEMKTLHKSLGQEIYDFYNVLWIERIDGVAYRKAMGRVWKDSWERQNVNVIKITLG
jgi:hypothetical protein